MILKQYPAILIKKLVKSYSSVEALKGISLEIKEGEFFGLLGPNGAGKTSAINILTGLSNKDSGVTRLFDKDVFDDYQEARALIGLVPQEFNFDQFETVYNIVFFSAGYFGIPKKDRPKKIEKVLRDLNLWEKRKAKAIQLSGGMKRKLMIARALIHNPKILILDEPTAGVDVETRKSLWSFFRKINKEGVTILLTTHYLEEAEELCERIAIINKGKIIKIDSKNNLLELLGGDHLSITSSKEIKEIPLSLKKFNSSLDKGRLLIPINKKTDWKDLLLEIQQSNLQVSKMETHKKNLEEIFIKLTNEN